MSDLLIRGGRILDPSQERDLTADLWIADGQIRQVAKNIEAPPNCQVIDANGRWVTPGLVELSCQAGEPGHEDRDTMRTALEAAARGGFTHVALEPNTSPVNDNPSVMSRLFELAKSAGLAPRILPLAALSKGLRGDEQTDAGELHATGAAGLSDGGTVSSFAFLRRALEYAGSHGLAVHLSASVDSRVNEAQNALRLGLRTQHKHEETALVRQACALAELSGAHVHVSALSTVDSLRALSDCSARVSAAVAVCNLVDDDAQLENYEPTSKLNPPLRSRSDAAALRMAVAQTQDLCFSARHRPRCTTEMCTTFDDAAGGRSTLETAVARSLTLVHQEGLHPLAWVRHWTLAPAAALAGAIAPSLSVGAPAHITIVDPNRAWKPTPSELRSRGKNLPPSARVCVGQVTHTIVDGRIAFEV